MKHPTIRKLKNRGLTPIRYRTPGAYEEARHGWVVSEGPKGGLVIRLVGEERNRRITKKERKYITVLA